MQVDDFFSSFQLGMRLKPTLANCYTQLAGTNSTTSGVFVTKKKKHD